MGQSYGVIDFSFTVKILTKPLQPLNFSLMYFLNIQKQFIFIDSVIFKFKFLLTGGKMKFCHPANGKHLYW